MAASSSRKRTRRSNGEGGYWYDKTTEQHRYRIRHEGKTHYVADKDPDRAKTKLRDLKRQLEDRVDVAGGTQTFRDFAVYCLEKELPSSVSETTLHDYAKRAGIYILPSLGDYQLCHLTKAIGQAWVSAMLQYRRPQTGEPWGLTPIRHALALAKRILDSAADGHHFIPFNPFASINPPRFHPLAEEKDDEEGDHALVDEQRDKILSDVKAHDKHHASTMGTDGRAVRSAGMYVLYVLAFFLGFRRGELLGLRMKDIDFDKRVIRIRQQVVRMDGTHKISKKLKTKNSRRDVPMLDDIAVLLRPHLLRVGAGRPDDLLFPAADGGPLRPDAVTKHFARVCKRVGLPGYHFHDTRHTFITNLRTLGTAVEVVRDMAGHEHADTTANIYSDANIARMRTALEAMRKLS